MTPRLAVEKLTRRFPGVLALDAVSLEVMPGEIHALLGENGAGKSTLGKIVAGVFGRDGGVIRLDGVDVGVIDEKAAQGLGIGIVHQEGSLVPLLSVAENIFAGRQSTRWPGRIDHRETRRRAAALLARLGVAIDPDRRVADLAPAQAQLVEIAKALSLDLKLLILDEPTAALTLTETARLFEVVRALARDGVSVVYVSHRLAEIFELCSRVTVLKDGRLVGTREVAGATPDDLIRMMVGRSVELARSERAHDLGEVVLEAEEVAAPPFVRSVSLTVRAGEIVCLAGLIGSGRSEFCEAVFGARRRTGGRVRIAGRELVRGGPWDGMAAGVGMVPEDRKTAGLFLGMSVADNITVTVARSHGARPAVPPSQAAALAQRFVGELRIATPSTAQLVGNLSGGNQQKVMLAKWLATEPRLLIVDEPSRGVDVGARAEIYRLLRELAGRGVALLVVSSDLPEVLALADRIVVIADGRDAGELPGVTATEEDVLRLATRHTVSAAAVRAGEPVGAVA